jgi:hypothetical protein
MATTELEHRLACACGASVTARARDAGGTITCQCGRSIAVPSLSRLRTLAGADAYTTNPVEAIRRAQQLGTDPPHDRCLLCGSPSHVTFTCHAVCESSYVKQAASDDSDMGTVVRWLLLPVIFNMLLAFRRGDREAFRQGHDVEVDFSLPLCHVCSTSNGNVTRPAVARRLMARVPIYKALLDYYPNLKLSVEQAAH